MTIVRNRKEYKTKQGLVFIEKYWRKGMNLFLWRYGVNGMILKDCLFSRPVAKRVLSGI